MNKTKICRLPKIIRKTHLSRSTIYNLIKAGKFPKQIKLSDRSVGWIEAEIEKWIQERVKKSRFGQEV